MTASDAPTKPEVRKPKADATDNRTDSQSGDEPAHASREATKAFEAGTTLPANRADVQQIVPNRDQTVSQLEQTQPASTKSIRADGGYTVTVDKNATGEVIRIAESDGTEWKRSPDGKFLTLNGSNEKIPVKDLKVNDDGTYSIVKPNGEQIRRNADRSVSSLDQNGNEEQRQNQDGSVLKFDKDHRVTATMDANGATRGYGYGADGKLNAVVDPDGSVWKSNDGISWLNQATKQLRGGEIKVENDGSGTIANANGGSTTLKIDGALVSKDKQGHVVAVKDHDGKEERFGYDQNGKLNQIKQNDGTILTSKDGTTWTQQGARSSYKADVSIDADGTAHFKFESGRESIQHTDGWTETKEKGKSLLTKTNEDNSEVVKNAQNQVLQVTDSNGKVHRFDYDQQGRVNKVTDENGPMSTRDGKSWKGTDGREVFQGRVEVGQDGTFREVKADGSRIVSKTDGSSISVDSNSHITRVEQANGSWKAFDLNARGQVVGVSDNNGNKLSTTDGVTWHNEKSGENKKMNVRVRNDGTYEEFSATGDHRISTTDGRTVTTDKNSRVQSVEAKDGAVVRYSYDQGGHPKGFDTSNPDGSHISFDAQGRVTRTEDLNHKSREFTYDKGQLSGMKDPDGKVWKTEDGQNWTSDKGDKFNGKVWAGSDGSYNYTENNSIVSKRLDQTTVHRDANGASTLENKDGQVIATVDAKGIRRSYERNDQGTLTKVREGDDTWSTTDGKNWTSSKNGAKWQGAINVEKDGTNYREDAAGNRQWRRPDGSNQDVNYKSMEKSADAIEYAFNGGLGIGTDKTTVNATLENKTADERKMIEQIWNQKYGTKYGYNLDEQFVKKLSGSDLDKATALLKRPDGADNAGTLRVALTEGHEWSGRSAGELNKVIRNTLETMSAADIAKTDAEYQKRYGTSLRDAIMKDPDVNAATKEAVNIYLDGADKRTPAQSLELAQKAAKNGDPEMFQEATRRAPKEVRDYFASNEGKQLLKDNFEGHWYNVFSGNMTDTNYNHVQDYAQFGKLSVASNVNDSTSWAGDNEKAIEKSLANMTEAERQSYDTGRKLSRSEQVDPNLTKEQKDLALDYYTKAHDKLQAAAGQWYSGDSQVNELAKWEDMISNKGGSLISRLAEHRGTIYDSSMQDVISSVENMSRSDWDKLHTDPTYKDKIQSVLNTYLSKDEYDRTMAVVIAKAGADSFEASQQNRRPLLDTMEDNRHWYGDNKDKMFEAISNMTDKERDSYKRGSDPSSTDEKAKEFAKSVDDKMRSTLSESGQKAAFELLDKVKRGEKPDLAIVDKLNIEASRWVGDKAQTVRDIQAEFEKDKGLQARLANPQTDADKAYAEKFKDAARHAMGDSAYEKYAKPLIETGHVPTELQLDLNRGIFNDDEQGAYKDIQHASAEEKQRILTDKKFQDRVLGFLSDDERKVALNSMQQGEMRPEDKLRSYQLGFGTSETEIKQTLAELNDRTQLRKDGKSESEIDTIIQQRLQSVRDEYAKKYGTDLSADLVSNLSGKDQDAALRDVAGRDTRAQFLYTLDEASTTRSGFGAGFVDKAWDGTGHQVDDQVNQMAAAMVNNPDQAREYMEKVQQAIELHQSSKEALADAVVDTAIAAAAVGGAVFTGGASLSLLGLTTMGAAAAGFKVGAKALIMGGDYNLSQAKFDGATGFADGFTALLTLGAGKTAAEKVLLQAGKTALLEGSEQTLRQGTEALIKKGLTDGISEQALQQLAKQVAKPGEEQAVAELLKKSISESIEKEARPLLKRLIMQTPQNVLAASAGGAASGVIRGAHDAHDLKEFVTIAGTSTAFAALGGAVAPFVLEPGIIGGGKVWNFVKNSVSKEGTAIENTAVKAEVAATHPIGTDNTRDGALVPAEARTPGDGPAIPPEARTPNDGPAIPPEARTPNDGPAIPPEARTPRDGTEIPPDTRTQPETTIRTSSEQTLPKPESDEPYKVSEYKPQPGQPDVVARPEAVAQSNAYGDAGEVRGKLQDGFQTVGGDTRIGSDGNFHDPNRPAVVLDRTQDSALRDTIAEAHARFDQFKNDPEKLAQELAKFSKEKMQPAGWSSKEVDDAQAMFRAQNGNKQILLGDFINRAKLGEGAGACQEQALLMKVLGDDFGLDISMSTGYLGKVPPGGIPPGYHPNHSFTELHLKDQTLVFDPRNDISGTPIDRLPRLTPSKDFKAGESATPETFQLKPGDTVSHDSTAWKVSNETPSNPGNLVLRRDGQVSVTPQELAAVNPSKKISVGSEMNVNVNGKNEGGWTVVGTNSDGTVKLAKADAVKLEVPPKDLSLENPQVARALGRDNTILAGPTSLTPISVQRATISSDIARSGLSKADQTAAIAAIDAHFRATDAADLVAVANKFRDVIKDEPNKAGQLKDVLDLMSRHRDVNLDLALRKDATMADLRGYISLGKSLDRISSIQTDAQPIMQEHIIAALTRFNDDAAVPKANIAETLPRLQNQIENIHDAMREFAARSSYTPAQIENYSELLKMGEDKPIRIAMRELMSPKAQQQAVDMYTRLTRESLAIDIRASSSQGHIAEFEAFKELRKLSATAPPEGWIFVPAMNGSAADSVGIDGVFINPRTNQFAPVDLAETIGTVTNKQVKTGTSGQPVKPDAVNKGRWAMAAGPSSGRNYTGSRLATEVSDFLGHTGDYASLTEKSIKLPIDSLQPNGAGPLKMPGFQKIYTNDEGEKLALDLKLSKPIPSTENQLRALTKGSPTGSRSLTPEEAIFDNDVRKRAGSALRDKHRNIESRLFDDVVTAIGTASDARKGPEFKPDPDLRAKIKVDEEMDKMKKYPYLEIKLPENSGFAGGATSVRVYEDGNLFGVKTQPELDMFPLGSFKSTMDKMKMLNVEKLPGSQAVPTPLTFPDIKVGAKPKDLFIKYPDLELLADALTRTDNNKLNATTNIGAKKALLDIQALAETDPAIKAMTGQEQTDLSRSLARARAATGNPELPLAEAEQLASLKSKLGPDADFDDVITAQAIKDRFDALAKSDGNKISLRQADVINQIHKNVPTLPDDVARAISSNVDLIEEEAFHVSHEQIGKIVERYKKMTPEQISNDLENLRAFVEKLPT